MTRDGHRHIRIESPAKLNLTFDITGTMDDGYHNVETLMIAIDLADDLLFEFHPAESWDVNLQVDYDGQPGLIPADRTNLIAKAIDLVVSRFDELNLEKVLPARVQVKVSKRIPIAAGMGGGSANAAAGLLAMNEYLNGALTTEQLEKLGAALGADVPFFIKGGLQTGLGRGDELTATTIGTQLHFIIVRPQGYKVDTIWAYKAFDKFVADKNGTVVVGAKIQSDLNLARTAIENGDVENAVSHFGNSFEAPIFKKYPRLAEICDILRSLGCSQARLTGSGPTLYGVADSAASAERIKSELIAGDTTLEAWTASSLNRGVVVSNPN